MAVINTNNVRRGIPGEGRRLASSLHTQFTGLTRVEIDAATAAFKATLLELNSDPNDPPPPAPKDSVRTSAGLQPEPEPRREPKTDAPPVNTTPAPTNVDHHGPGGSNARAPCGYCFQRQPDHSPENCHLNPRVGRSSICAAGPPAPVVGPTLIPIYIPLAGAPIFTGGSPPPQQQQSQQKPVPYLTAAQRHALDGDPHWYAIWSPAYMAGPWFGTWAAIKRAIPRARFGKKLKGRALCRAYLSNEGHPGGDAPPRYV